MVGQTSKKSSAANFSPLIPANARATAVNKLEGTHYFQGTRPLDDYLNEFRELISDAKYDSSPATVVIKFR